MVITPTAAFWRGKRILITGHTGFKGGWLSLWLHSMGADVHGLALEPSTTPNLFTVSNVASSLASHTIGDICSLTTVQRTIKEVQPEVVIHMAAQPLVRESYEEPVKTFATNVMGTVNVLEAVRHVPSIKVVLVVTTDKCYENREWLWGYREDDPMGGHDPYSSSKGCAELVTSAYRRSFFNKASSCVIATARAGNVIGGGDWAADRLLPDIFRDLEINQPAIIRQPQATRPWQHVLEPLSGYLTLAEHLYINGQSFAESWNFGPNADEDWPVHQIVTNIVNIWGNGASWQSKGGNHPHEANYLKLDISKAKARLGWQPRWTIRHALQASVDWQQEWLAGNDMRKVTLNQIERYQLSSLPKDQLFSTELQDDRVEHR